LEKSPIRSWGDDEESGIVDVSSDLELTKPEVRVSSIAIRLLMWSGYSRDLFHGPADDRRAGGFKI